MDGKKLLLIEDDDFLRKLFLKKLRSLNYEIDEAIDGKMGLEKALKNKPDLVILDMIIPLMDGFEILKQIRASQDIEVAKTPVLVLSNLGQKSDIRKALALGANDYLIKAHFTTDEIAQKIEQQLKEAEKKKASELKSDMSAAKDSDASLAELAKEDS